MPDIERRLTRERGGRDARICAHLVQQGLIEGGLRVRLPATWIEEGNPETPIG